MSRYQRIKKFFVSDGSKKIGMPCANSPMCTFIFKAGDPGVRKAGYKTRYYCMRCADLLNIYFTEVETETTGLIEA